jgi:hypothetical protein
VKHGAALISVVLLLSTWLMSAHAQEATRTPSPTPSATPVDALVQTVVVDQHKFQVDSFYPCQSFITARVSKLGSQESETAVVTTITIQMFIRSGAQMIALDPFSTFESDVTATVPVGGTFSCKPPVVQSPTPEDAVVGLAGVNP